MCYTDTDSFVLEIETNDLYKDIEPDKAMIFDTSNYSDNHFLKYNENKRVLGKYKDELAGKIMTEFAGLSAKNYAFRSIDGEEHKRCKGIKKCIVDSGIHFEDYKECLLSGEEEYRTMSIMRSYKHEIFTEEINKKALSSFDAKRCILGDKINTLALGHYETKNS